jgi:hypothetical protein
MKCSFVLVLLVHSLVAHAQRDPIREKIKADSLVRLKYVGNAKHSIMFYVFGTRYSNGILYRGHSSLLYSPITPVNIGIGFSHKWLGGSVSVVSIQSAKSRLIDHYNFSIQVNAYSRKVGADMSYIVNSGYYQSNYQNFLSYNQVNKDQTASNMRMQRFALNFIRIFNGKNYSLNAPVDQGEIQKKSASSFLLSMGVGWATAGNGDSTFVPSYLDELFQHNTILKKGVFTSFNVMPGYGFTWVIKKNFFVGIVPSVGLSFQYQHLILQNGEEDHVRVSYKALGRFGAGYHSTRWTFGISAIFDAENYPLGNGTYLVNNVGRLHARIGYKFNVPKWARKYSQKMDDYQDEVEDALPDFDHRK